jgi:putative membrane protein
MTKSYKTHFAAILSATLLFSCGDVDKSEDPLKVAEKHNEEKFDNETEKTADFMMYAADMSMHEIQLGELAQGNAHDKVIKNLGSKMAEDHRKALQDLREIAGQKNITLPETVSNERQEDCDKLSKKTRQDFDKEYAEMMVDQHKEALKRFEKEAEEGADKEVRTWAFNMLPSLRTHLDHALECDRRLGNKGDTAVVIDHGKAGVDNDEKDRKNRKEEKDTDNKDNKNTKEATGSKTKKDW